MNNKLGQNLDQNLDQNIETQDINMQQLIQKRVFGHSKTVEVSENVSTDQLKQAVDTKDIDLPTASKENTLIAGVDEIIKQLQTIDSHAKGMIVVNKESKQKSKNTTTFHMIFTKQCLELEIANPYKKIQFKLDFEQNILSYNTKETTEKKDFEFFTSCFKKIQNKTAAGKTVQFTLREK